MEGRNEGCVGTRVPCGAGQAGAQLKLPSMAGIQGSVTIQILIQSTPTGQLILEVFLSVSLAPHPVLFWVAMMHKQKARQQDSSFEFHGSRRRHHRASGWALACWGSRSMAAFFQTTVVESGILPEVFKDRSQVYPAASYVSSYQPLDKLDYQVRPADDHYPSLLRTCSGGSTGWRQYSMYGLPTRTIL